SASQVSFDRELSAAVRLMQLAPWIRNGSRRVPRDGSAPSPLVGARSARAREGWGGGWILGSESVAYASPCRWASEFASLSKSGYAARKSSAFPALPTKRPITRHVVTAGWPSGAAFIHQPRL